MNEKLEKATNTISINDTIISTQKKTISKQKSEIADLEKEVARYNAEWIKSFDKTWFMDNCVVIVGDSNNKYHKYGCEDLDLSYFYVFNVENARAQGYRACSKCN